MNAILPVVGFSLVSALIVVALIFVRRGIWLPLAVGWSLRMLCAFGAYSTVGFFAPDAAHYDATASQIAMVWHHAPDATMPAIGAGKDAFPYLLAGIEYIFGHNPLLGLIVNVTAGTLLIAVIAATTKRLGGKPETGAWATALFPPFLLWGGLLLREAITWLALAVAVWALVWLVARLTNWWAWGAFVGSLIVLLGFRGSATVIVAAAGLLALALAQRRVWVTVVSLALTVVVAAVAVGSYGLGHIEASRVALATARTGAFPSGAVGDVLVVLPKVLLGPFPWEWLQVGIPFALDAILWLAVLWFTWRGWRRSTNRRAVGAVLLPAAALLLALVVTSGNYGTMQRLRVQSTVMILPLAAVGLRSRRVDDDAQRGQTGQQRGERSIATL